MKKTSAEKADAMCATFAISSVCSFCKLPFFAADGRALLFFSKGRCELAHQLILPERRQQLPRPKRVCAKKSSEGKTTATGRPVFGHFLRASCGGSRERKAQPRRRVGKIQSECLSCRKRSYVSSSGQRKWPDHHRSESFIRPDEGFFCLPTLKTDLLTGFEAFVSLTYRLRRATTGCMPVQRRLYPIILADNQKIPAALFAGGRGGVFV